MPDLDQIRTATEQELAALLRRLNARARAKVVAAIERYGSVQAIPQEFWEAIEREADSEAAALLLLLLLPAYTSMQNRVSRLPGIPPGGPTDEELLRRQASIAAARLGVDTVRQHVDGIRARLAREVDGDIPRLNTLPPREAEREVRRKIADALPTKPPEEGGDSADRTAVTNSTRAVSVGQVSAARDEGLRRQVQIDVKWATEKDGKVCRICRPLHNRPSIEWVDRYPTGPPAHPNCRCEVVPYFQPQAQPAGAR